MEENKKIEFTQDELKIIKKIFKEKNNELRKLIYEGGISTSNELHYYLTLDSLESAHYDVINILSKLDSIQ